MADINKIKINGTEYNISPEWASTGTNTIAIGTSSTTGVKLGTVASFTSSSSTIKSDYIQLQDTGSTYPTLTLGSDTNSVSINGGLIVRGGDVELSGGTVTAGYVVGDSATINNGFEVKGDTTISGTLGVTGLTTLGTVTAKGITASGNTSISGNTTIGGNLNVTGVSTLGTITMGSGAKISNSLNISGGLSVAGSSTFSSTINAKSGIYCTGDATVYGNISLGSSNENIISSSNKLTLRGSGGIEIGNNYGIIKSSEYNGIQLGTSSAPGLVLGSKNDVTLGNTSSTTVIDGDSITLGDYIKLSSGYINTYNVPLEGSSASFSNDVNISGTLNAKGVLNVTSAATFSNTATISGALKANSTLSVAGTSTFTGAVTANGALTVKSDFTSPDISDVPAIESVFIGGDALSVEKSSKRITIGTSGSTVNINGAVNISDSMITTDSASSSIDIGFAGMAGLHIDAGDTTVLKHSVLSNNAITITDSIGLIDIAANKNIYINAPSINVWNTTDGTVDMEGSLNIGSSLTVSSVVLLKSALNAQSSLYVGKEASFNSTATVSGALKANSTLTSTGAATFNSTVTANGAVTANKGLTANTSFVSPHIFDSYFDSGVYIYGSNIIIGTKGYNTIIKGDPVIINGITITNNLTNNTITLKNANGYSITLPLTSTSTTSSASSTGSGT